VSTADPNVVVDTRLASRGLGIGRFLANLFGGFQELGFVPKTFGSADGSFTSAGEFVRSQGARAVAFSLSPRLCGVDPNAVVHFACNSGSLLAPRRSVLTVHDFLQRDATTAVGKAQWILLQRSLTTASRVVAISSLAIDELRRAGVPDSRIRLVTHGMRDPKQFVQARAGVLAFGGTSARKRPELLVRICESLAATGYDSPITIVARAGLTKEHGARLMAIGAEIVRDASDNELDALYAGRAALVVTSSHEGFGLPLVEAAEHQIPVVLGEDAIVAPEAIGPHCVLVPSSDPVRWASIVREVASGPAPEYTAYLPSWKEVAMSYLDVYREVS
jgi:glycosyltransferase involved in cell wall biosynthesis